MNKELKKLIEQYTEIAKDIAGDMQKPGSQPYYDGNMGKVEIQLSVDDKAALESMVEIIENRGYIEVDRTEDDEPSYIVFKHPTDYLIVMLEYETIGRAKNLDYLSLWVGYNEEDIDLIEEPHVCNCPLGGDEHDDCADCAYAGDYHYVNGECVIRCDSTEECEHWEDEVKV